MQTPVYLKQICSKAKKDVLMHLTQVQSIVTRKSTKMEYDWVIDSTGKLNDFPLITRFSPDTTYENITSS